MKSTKVLTQEKKEEKIINIFDLDGCSMKQVFPNTITEVSPAKMISKLQDITLFPAFLRYYLLSSRKTIANIFITGRRKSNYERITKDQLRPAKAIKSYEIRYFNEDLKYTDYHFFKATKILFTIAKYTSQYPNAIIKIFDDDTTYYKTIIASLSLLKEPERHNIVFYEITSNEDWKHIQENIVSFFGIKEESFSQLLNKRHEN